MKMDSIYGAKISSFSERNYRSLFKRILDNNPSLDRDSAVELFIEECEKEENHIERQEALRYCGTNTWSSLTKPYTPRVMSTNTIARDEFKKLHEAKEMMTRLLPNGLATILPNGKVLSDCLGTELVEVGGILSFIGNRIPEGQLVGEVIHNDEQLTEVISAFRN